jgi:hypothetical protein
MQVGVQEVNFNEDTQIPYTVARCRTEFRWNITLLLRHADCLFSEVRTYSL